ncbi:phosphoadenosine phosphosulfate reductase [Aurantimonas manganoxydans SI85-9A1]|uniref:Adenosine 5'-phosphosulfate reductase n=2 Tax=Aurantimonas manganoxydans TaxID=651183 RepID=Q1YDZ3_AURMS|nr:phosphoadenylyl-sulfate reductase [Aurantimonas manganoxydans]EAS48465.1 phosphoadenosine phosphosulfate reductase [Aurantimonas manganoxydans SI85-9A1]BAT29046.1 phosphoadenosine phosphosulfate reductase [Aurantimonas manganoxydans SI85-9A1]
MTATLPDLAATLNGEFAGLTPLERLQAMVARVDGPVVFTTSLGIEDQMITHLIFSNDLPIQVKTLDTGRLFPETYALWRETEEKYGRRIRAMYPQAEALEELVNDQGIDGFYYAPEFRKNCCGVRKVEPLGRALAGAAGWITGLRRDQSANRSDMDYVAFDGARGLIKANPIFDWTRERIASFTAAGGVPVNALHAQNFLSIGCAPCTRAIRPGEPERAGRWWWEEETKRECGLHVDDDGRPMRADNNRPAEGDAAFERLPQ